MKKKKKWWIVACVALLAIAWVARYRSLNAFYDARNTETTEVYSMGEEIPFEDDYVEFKDNPKGYTLCVDAFEIVDFDTLLSSLDTSSVDVLSDDFQVTDKVALVTFTLRNVDSEAAGILLTDFWLMGIDQNAYLNYDLLPLLNPILQDSYGITMDQGVSYQLTLPYGMDRYYFSAAWSHLDEYPLYFRMTCYPTQKLIQVQ